MIIIINQQINNEININNNLKSDDFRDRYLAVVVTS